MTPQKSTHSPIARKRGATPTRPAAVQRAQRAVPPRGNVARPPQQQQRVTARTQQPSPATRQSRTAPQDGQRCQQARRSLFDKAAKVESQAIVQSKRKEHAQAARLFRVANNLRNEAKKLQCR